MPEPTLTSAAGGARASRSRFLRRAWRVAGAYWSSERRWRTRGATFLLFALTVAQVGLTVWGNYWDRELFDALEARSVQRVLVQVGVFALLFSISIAVTAAHLLVKRWLQLDWRNWLSERVVGRWLDDGRHYRLQFTPGEHDNPDGRIAEDIRIATESAIGLAHTLAYSTMVLGLFVGILWNVSGSIAVPGTSMHVRGYLVPLAVLYAALGSVIGWGFGRPLVRTTNALQTAEASFRFGLARAREHSEAIAMMRGEPIERSRSTLRFRDIVRDWDRQSFALLGVVSFATAYGALLPVFPILVAAPQYITGAMSLGVLMQAAQAFQRVTSALSWPVDNLGEIARCRASADRMLSLYEDMQRLDVDALAPGTDRIALVRSERSRLVIEDLCIADPAGWILLEPFSAEIRRGERVLIAGDPAVTSSLFKVLGGLWPWGTGRVRLPADGRVQFMPQRPFLPEGTLRRALCYPHPADAFNDAAVRRALESAGIGWLAPRLDAVDHWEQSLPLRAQQRLGFGRALLQRPAWIFMEEATDAFDPKGERLILEMLYRELSDSGVLAISFHPGLESLHQRKIVLTRARERRLLHPSHRDSEREPAPLDALAEAPRG